MPDPASLKVLYDSETWFEGGRRGGYQSYDQQTAQILPIFEDLLAQYESTLSGREILDIGCGYGSHLAIAASHGWKCFGVEISDYAREVARRRHGDSIYLTDQVEHLLPHQFDLILMLDVLEHLTDPYKLLYDLFSRGAITPDTCIVITTPNARCWDAVSDPAGWAYRHPPSHLIYFSGKSCETLLTRLRFGRVEVSGLHPLASPVAVGYADENSSINDGLAGYGGLLCQASGSDFMAFMHERYVPGTWSKITEYEHLPRYLFAKQFANGANVLDFGCGTGYGTALLAEVAKSVVGLDIDAAALESARQTHKGSNLKFEQNSDLCKGLPDASFDLITCFELIEHLDERHQQLLINNLARLLTPRGQLLISTPNPHITAHYGENRYHLREMNEEEFEQLLRTRFRNIRMMQQFVRPNVTITEGSGSRGQVEFYTSEEGSEGVPANYFAICSHAPIQENRTFCYFDTSGDYIGERLALEKLFNEAQAGLYQTRQIVADHRRHIDSLRSALTQQDAALITTRVELAQLAAEIQAKNSALSSLAGQCASLQTTVEAFKRWKFYRLREALNQPFSLHKVLRVSYLLLAIGTPRRVRLALRPLITALKARLSAFRNPASALQPKPKTRPIREICSAGRLRLASRQASSLPKNAHVSVVIPTKNAGTAFAEVLQGLKAQEYEGKIDLTIVDSGSRDHTLETAEQFQARIIRVNPGSFDHGLTRNLGIEHAEGEVIVLLTQDAVPGTPHMIRHLIRAFADPAVAGVYGRQVPRADADILTQRKLNNWLTGRSEPQVVSLDSVRDYDSLPPMKQYELSNFDNVCSAIRKSVWQDLPFRQNEFAEDLEWSRRVLQAGGKIAYEPEAFVVHSHRRSLSYEYKRTYVCHRKLYKLFRLNTLPSRSSLIKAIPRGILNDWAYVWRYEPDLSERIALLTKTPLLNLLTAYAQYVGARDEKELRIRRVVGI